MSVEFEEAWEEVSELAGGLGFADGVCWKGFWGCLLKVVTDQGSAEALVGFSCFGSEALPVADGGPCPGKAMCCLDSH